jgi:hypothetical protein
VTPALSFINYVTRTTAYVDKNGNRDGNAYTVLVTESNHKLHHSFSAPPEIISKTLAPLPASPHLQFCTTRILVVLLVHAAADDMDPA